MNEIPELTSLKATKVSLLQSISHLSAQHDKDRLAKTISLEKGKVAEIDKEIDRLSKSVPAQK